MVKGVQAKNRIFNRVHQCVRDRRLYEVVPGLPGAVVVREVATPLTYLDRGHRSEGAVAGWSWRFGDYPEPWARSLAVTPVQGLFMVGLQSFTRLFYGGMGTSMYSGKYAADLVLSGKTELMQS